MKNFVLDVIRGVVIALALDSLVGAYLGLPDVVRAGTMLATTIGELTELTQHGAASHLLAHAIYSQRPIGPGGS